MTDATAGDADRARLLDASERRLIRLGFDIHDGALQDVAALAHDLHVFRSQLESLLGERERKRVLARLDEIDARVAAIGHELRELAGALESRSIADQPLREALDDELDAFRARGGIDADLSVQGDFTTTTRSQRFAIVRIVQEALSNVREHSGARAVRVSVVRDDDGISVEVSDDGRGFEVEEELARTAARGRLGLLCMRERVRLLAGTVAIESRPGGPTRITARLPAWSDGSAGG